MELSQCGHPKSKPWTWCNQHHLDLIMCSVLCCVHFCYSTFLTVFSSIFSKPVQSFASPLLSLSISLVSLLMVRAPSLFTGEMKQQLSNALSAHTHVPALEKPTDALILQLDSVYPHNRPQRIGLEIIVLLSHFIWKGIGHKACLFHTNAAPPDGAVLARDEL